MKPIVITGGPGAGKTTMINALAAEGAATFEEASRVLIEQQSQLDSGVLPWNDLSQFAWLCLDYMATQKSRARDHDIAFVDRGIGDIVAYLKLANLDVDNRILERAAGYHSQVLICRPEASIYVQDEVRPYPYEHALEIHSMIESVYLDLGYELIEVPWGTVEQRVEFVKGVTGLHWE